MAGLRRLAKGIARQFGYDAVSNKKKRGAPKSTNKSEDKVLKQSDRLKLVGTSRDLQRNFTVAAWMIRKHLDYVARFSFQAKTGDADFDAALEKLMKRWSSASRCDAAGRHNLARFMRLVEAGRTIDGDVFIVKRRSGQMQAIEGDRVRDPNKANLPNGLKKADLTQGIEVDTMGRARRYVICARDGGGYKYDRTVSAAQMLHHGYFTRFDQVRGVSPLAGAINTMKDLYEGFDYNLVKTKIHALFGLAIYRDADIDGLPHTDRDTGEAPDADTERYEVALGPTPFKLELDPGDKAEFLESKTPSSEFRDYSELMIRVALLALDIPYIFFDSLKGSYSVHRTDIIQYVNSCEPKREENRSFLNRVTVWKVLQWLEAGELVLPAGVALPDIQWHWQHAGIPWIDPLKEVTANIRAIEAGLVSRTQVCKERGLEWEDIVRELSRERDILEKAGLVTAPDA